MFRLFRIPLAVTLAAIVGAYFLGGITAAVTVAILGLLEITFSFDNAIVNSKILGRMSKRWQTLFLTVGILIAVFGMRLVFPLLIVAISAHINPWEALRLATSHPEQYAHHIEHAHPAIAGFGGAFLLMLFLDWLFSERDVYWLRPLENLLARLGRLQSLPTVITLVLLLIASTVLDHQGMVLSAGLLGLITYLLVSSIDTFFNEDMVASAAKAGLATFLYLEVLDASFSFDGVVGAFAVTNNIFLISLGLGIGAMFVRGLTVYLTNAGKLAEYRYLEHGAHWAIGSLAVLLLLTIKYDISDVVTGLIGLTFIGLAFINSIVANRKEA